MTQSLRRQKKATRMRTHDWLLACERIFIGKSAAAVECPNCGQVKLEFLFTGDPATRKGTCDVWCANCNKGIHLFRALAPEWAEMVSFEDAKKGIKLPPKYDKRI